MEVFIVNLEKEDKLSIIRDAAKSGVMLGSVKENSIWKGCHMQILSLFIICGSTAGQPAVCSGCKI